MMALICWGACVFGRASLNKDGVPANRVRRYFRMGSIVLFLLGLLFDLVAEFFQVFAETLDGIASIQTKHRYRQNDRQCPAFQVW